MQPDPLVWLTTPIARTGTPALDHVLNDLKLSCHCLWLGNPYLIKKNCVWVDGKTSSKATLQWRDNAPNKWPDSKGDAVFSIIGMVSANGMSLDADCKWQNLCRLNHSVRLVTPDSLFNIPELFWDAQSEGAEHLVQDSYQSSNSSQQVTFCFITKPENYLHLCSPLFLPSHCTEEPVESDDDPTSLCQEAVTQQGRKFETWNMGSEEGRQAFEQTIKEGHRPQALPAYNYSDKPIHPNNVSAELTGAIVLAFCMLQWLKFLKDKGAHGIPGAH
ncbi:hypothetical protein FRC12_008790 [Ceratobasidium sp. 428]|nr:hypothetical protein FRC12_008790 [Ceratobasidium sp. 428]